MPDFVDVLTAVGGAAKGGQELRSLKLQNQERAFRITAAENEVLRRKLKEEQETKYNAAIAEAISKVLPQEPGAGADLAQVKQYEQAQALGLDKIRDVAVELSRSGHHADARWFVDFAGQRIQQDNQRRAVEKFKAGVANFVGSLSSVQELGDTAQTVGQTLQNWMDALDENPGLLPQALRAYETVRASVVGSLAEARNRAKTKAKIEKLLAEEGSNLPTRLAKQVEGIVASVDVGADPDTALKEVAKLVYGIKPESVDDLVKAGGEIESMPPKVNARLEAMAWDGALNYLSKQMAGSEPEDIVQEVPRWLPLFRLKAYQENGWVPSARGPVQTTEPNRVMPPPNGTPAGRTGQEPRASLSDLEAIQGGLMPAKAATSQARTGAGQTQTEPGQTQDRAKALEAQVIEQAKKEGWSRERAKEELRKLLEAEGLLGGG